MKPAARQTPPTPSGVPPLRAGERLTQPEFHRRYQAYPKDVKAELVGGVVYMPSPLRRPHGTYHAELSGALWLYKNATPGVELLDNATAILGAQSEPQPDLALRILAAYGGQSGENADDYVEGGPELVAEVADSTAAVDLRQKRTDYEQAGVAEYLVLCIAEKELHWFDFKSGGMVTPNRRGVAQSRVFPGLWVHVAALLTRASAWLVEAVQQGLSSRPHAAFAKRLEAARRREARGGQTA